LLASPIFSAQVRLGEPGASVDSLRPGYDTDSEGTAEYRWMNQASPREHKNQQSLIWKNGDVMLERAHSERPDYRETIQRTAIGDRKYIRFFDGRGHFAHVQLQLIPRPGDLRLVTKSDGFEIPDPCYDAARASILRKLDSGPIHSYPMSGLEVRMLGATFLPKYSYPEAFARAASMAFDEAVRGASPIVIERWSGFILKVDPNSVKKTLETLTVVLGEVPASISFNASKQCFVIRAQAPVRLLSMFKEVFYLRRLETYLLPEDQCYREMSELPPKERPPSSSLDEWT
jgi:Elongation factor G, domain IV